MFEAGFTYTFSKSLMNTRTKKTTSFNRNLSFSVLFALWLVILLRSDIMLRTVLFASRVYANKISLKLKVSISLLHQKNITLPSGIISLIVITITHQGLEHYTISFLLYILLSIYNQICYNGCRLFL